MAYRGAVASEAGRDLLGPGEKVLCLLGVWPPPGPEARGRLRGRLPAPLLGLQLGMVGVLASTAAHIHQGGGGDEDEEARQTSVAIFIVGTVIGMLVKIWSFMGQRGRMQLLLGLLLEMRRRYQRDSRGARPRAQANGVTLFYILQVNAVAAALAWSVQPLISGADRRLPLPAWLPFDATASPYYEAVYVGQALSLLLVPQISLCLNICYFALMLHLAAELAILRDNVAVVGWRRPSKEAAFQAERQAVDREFAAAPENRLLEDNVRHHQLIIRAVSELEQIMSTSVYIHLFVNMINVCSHIFVISVVLLETDEMAVVVSTASSLAVFLSGIALYCIIGHTIIDQSEQLPEAVYSSGWTGADASFRSTVSILMVRASQPLSITVGKMRVLSKPTFVQVLNGSYTLFNFLYRTQSDKERKS
ncbi:odorant receptor Or1-like [Schistocerca gregaria]|nr:odorant receptor Or1-like [Schistocerca gregaria]